MKSIDTKIENIWGKGKRYFFPFCIGKHYEKNPQ